MSDTFKTELETIRAETPLSVRADPGGLLYGVLFIALGVWLFDLGATPFAVLMIGVGAVGALAGIATFVSDSPGVKVVQAVDSLLMALVLAGFGLAGDAGGVFENPLLALGLGAFMLWAAWDDLREYEQLRRARREREARS